MDPSETKESVKIERVAVVPEFKCKGGKYILVLKSKPRQEWEIPGGRIESPDTLLDARRELSEETGLKLDFQIGRIPLDMDKSTTLKAFNTSIAGGRSNLEIKTIPVLATAEVNELPTLTFDKDSEHDDYMFIQIPVWEQRTERADYLAMIKQLRARKLVFARKRKGKIVKINRK